MCYAFRLPMTSCLPYQLAGSMLRLLSTFATTPSSTAKLISTIYFVKVYPMSYDQGYTYDYVLPHSPCHTTSKPSIPLHSCLRLGSCCHLLACHGCRGTEFGYPSLDQRLANADHHTTSTTIYPVIEMRLRLLLDCVPPVALLPALGIVLLVAVECPPARLVPVLI
jgi:hypothetical protein